jgi:hypothetical protein
MISTRGMAAIDGIHGLVSLQQATTDERQEDRLLVTLSEQKSNNNRPQEEA